MLSGKVAVVTGGAIGIGRGICIKLAEAGANIAALDRDTENNEETAALVRGAGGECLSITCDVGDPDEVKAAVERVLAAFGRIDVLVNNAAIWDNSSIIDGTYESQTQAFAAAMGACIMGTYNCTRAVAPKLVEAGGGNIVNMITEHVKEGHYLSGRTAYGYDCAKFGQWRFTEMVSEELAPHGIRVNGLCFGATDTPMLRGVAPEIAEQAMKPEDLGQAVLNVIGQGPDGPTGQTWLFGTSGTVRADSLPAIDALAAAG